MRGDKVHSADSIAAALVARLVAGHVDFDMYPKQREFVESAAHHLAFIAGIGSGKSMAGAMRGIRAALGRVGRATIRTPNLGVVTAPTYTMLDDATIRTYLDLCQQYVVGFDPNKHYKQHHLTLPNGSEILFRSTQHPDRLRGPSISWWMGDEAALSPPAARRLMIGRLRQFGQLGYEWVTTTPKGRNWVWQTFVRDASDGYGLIKARTDENTYLRAEVIEAWQREYSGDFARQELEGEFVAFEGLIYADFHHERHVVRDYPVHHHQIVAGVDWGYANPGVIVVCVVDGDGRVWVVAEHVQTQRRITEWVDVAKQVRDQWRVEAFYCDPSEPDYIRQFSDAGLKAQAADNRVLPGIQAVQNRLADVGGGQRPLLVVHERCAHTLTEFDQYQWAENQHGIKDAPLKTNDHTMDALRYAVMGVNRKPVRVTGRSQSYV